MSNKKTYCTFSCAPPNKHLPWNITGKSPTWSLTYVNSPHNSGWKYIVFFFHMHLSCSSAFCYFLCCLNLHAIFLKFTLCTSIMPYSQPAISSSATSLFLYNSAFYTYSNRTVPSNYTFFYPLTFILHTFHIQHHSVLYLI